MSPQETIAHYRVIGKLGEGGMGAVYRATDTKLNRDVAIKVIPESFAKDPDRLARFTREAQVLASLNHPNIAAIYGVEERAIVLELVEGPDLAGPLPEEQALPIVHQLVDALEYAHDRGIVHRDLKPANLKLSHDGRLKVLDFGLAKALTIDSGALPDQVNSPTLTMRATMAGVIMGTAAYMSPEQARGQNVDKRADIWSFGVVVYELLTGKQLFEGESVTDTLAHVLTRDPNLSEVPPRFQRLVQLCLVRDPRQRLRDISGARLLLDEAPAAVPAPAGSQRTLKIVAAVALAVAALQFGWYLFRPAAVPQSAVRFNIAFPEDTIEIPTPAGRTFVPSPDGRNIVFAAMDKKDNQQHLWIRPIDNNSARKLERTEGANFPFWSPDSQSVGFFAEQSLRRVDITSGALQTICEFAVQIVNRAGNGAAWSANDVVLFNVRGPLEQVPASGGRPQRATELDASTGEVAHTWPQFLPGGKRFLFFAQADKRENSGIYAGELGSKFRSLILRATAPAVYDRAGFLLFVQAWALMAQPFDASSLRLSGAAVPVGGDVTTSEANGRAAIAVSDSGLLIFRSRRDMSQSSQLSWFDRAGKRLATIGKPGAYTSLRLSPDGKFASFIRNADRDSERGKGYLAIMDLATSVISRAAPDEARRFEWTPDSRHILYSRASTGLFEVALDTGATVEIKADQPLPGLEAISPDGQLLLLHDDLSNRTFVLPRTGDRRLKLVLDQPSRRSSFRISPDGTKVAWNATEESQPQVYIAAFPAFTNKRQVSSDGGGRPVWRRDGRELFYTHDDGLMSVTVEPGVTIQTGIPKLLFSFGANGRMNPVYAPAADNQRFLMIESTGEIEAPQIVAVLNWAAGLKH